MNNNQKNEFNTKYTNDPISYGVMDFLNNLMENKDSKYSQYVKVYFIESSDPNKYGRVYGIGGTPNSKRSVIVLTKGFSDSTVAHETLHAMSLYHTFDNNSKFTFKRSETDNIMDYSDVENRKIPVISTFVWQWRKMWNFLKWFKIS